MTRKEMTEKITGGNAIKRATEKSKSNQKNGKK